MQKIKYGFFKNTSYAIDGIKDIFKNETSFKVELGIIIPLWIGLFFVEIAYESKMILAISLFLPLFAEAINSAIERVVDLVTLETHPLAKSAKDAGSAIVFISIAITLCIWASIIYTIIFNTSAT